MLTREEAIRIIKILKAQYPDHYKNIVTKRQSEEIIRKTIRELRNHDFDIVKDTVYAWISMNPTMHPKVTEICDNCYRNPKHMDKLFEKLERSKSVHSTN